MLGSGTLRAPCRSMIHCQHGVCRCRNRRGACIRVARGLETPPDPSTPSNRLQRRAVGASAPSSTASASAYPARQEVRARWAVRRPVSTRAATGGTA
ncbi:MAG: hypothetical protein QOI95_3940 [Acidimicrobiaceae bacterium]|jgi:hypothetical protein